jgi:Tfp pilus assembly protein PilW
MMIWLHDVRRKNLDYDFLTRGTGVKGLSYVEVMVSMLTSALFLSTTLQAYIAATGIKARSQQMNTAIASIQADVETIRHIAQVVPKTTADCQLPPSNSYAQQVISNVIASDRAAFGMSPSNPSPQATIGALDLGESILQQSSTLPINGLPDDYKLHRTLSVDQREVSSAQVLQISYQVLRTSTQSTQSQAESEQSQSTSIQSETLLAQLHTSILPGLFLGNL